MVDTSEGATGSKVPEPVRAGAAAGIVCRGVTVGYSRTQALTDVSFEIREPAIYIVLGQNGAGKTTLFRTLAGVLRPWSGSIEVDGIPNRFLEARGRLPFRSHIDGMPGGLRVEEALAFYAQIERVSQTDVGRVLQLLGLEEFRDRFLGELSQGQRKRVAVARIFLRERSIYLLDEPTTSLDPRIPADIRDLILGLSRDKIVLYSSHNLFEAREIGTYVLTLKGGRLTHLDRIRDLRPIRCVIGIRGAGVERALPSAERDGEYRLLQLAGPEEVPKVVAELVAKGVQIQEVREMRNPLEDLLDWAGESPPPAQCAAPARLSVGSASGAVRGAGAMAKLNCGTFELYYEDSGGSGEPVALIHGSWGDHHQWDPVTALLTPGFRVISYDRRGHGASSAPGHSLALADQVSDLSALLSVIGRGSLHLVATGVGASIALQLALLRPDQVRSVNVHEPPLLGLLTTDPQAAEALAEFRALEARIHSRVRAGDALGAAQAYANGVSAEPGGWAQLSPAVQAAFTASAAAATKESADPAAQNIELSRFASYRDPIVLTGGTRSAPVFRMINDQVSGAFYGALRYAFDGAGHFPYVTHPEAFVRVVGEFCRYAAGLAK